MDSFNDIVKAEYHNKPIHIYCIISGKGLSPYCIPRVIEIQTKESTTILTIEPVDADILRFIDIPTTRIRNVIKDIFKVDKFSYEVTEVQNIERIFILPSTGRERNKLGSTYVAYYSGCGLEINTMYELKGYTTTDPSNQTITHVFTEASKIKSDIESFSLTKAGHNVLKQFDIKPKSVDDIFDYLEDLYESYAHNITKIYGRFDLHLAIDLAFRSVISFRFQNELVSKGWSDIMIIGDTRCGKGYIAEKLAKYFAVGEVISAENCSIAGLIGGLQQYNNSWAITWGKIPLNDCGLIILDEASELQDEAWSKLSRVRSEGIAEITKIQTQVTNARTRLIFLANPINKTIANYSYGIQAILDVVKAPEDIARFDYVLVVAHDEVKMEDINRKHELMKSQYSIQAERDLVLWIWSRKISEIAFSSEAVKLVYKLSITLAKEYSFDIPLIQGENIRVKLSKIAIGFAGRLYSNKNNGKILYIKEIHVLCAYTFLNLIYKKEPCGYYAISKLQKPLATKNNEKLKHIEKYFNSYKDKIELCRCLLINNNITANDLSDHMDLSKEISREIISYLLRYDCISKRSLYYVKTPTFTSWLKNIILPPQK